MAKLKKEQVADVITTGLGVGGVVLGTTALVFPDQLDRRLGFGLRQTAWGSFSFRAIGMRDLAFGVGILTARAKSREASARWQALFAASLALDSYSCIVEQGKPGANVWMRLTAWGLPVVSAAALVGSTQMRNRR